MKNRFIEYFLKGLLYIVPIGATLWVLWKVFKYLDNLLPFSIPGVSLLLILIFIVVVGVIAEHLISNKLIEIFERWLKKAPLISLIYTSVKDLMNAFVGEKKSFTRPVSVKFAEDSEVRRLGYITNENFRNLRHAGDLITVYIPHSYNISGNVFLVPERYVEPLHVNASDLMKYTVSGGVTTLEEKAEMLEKTGKREK